MASEGVKRVLKENVAKMNKVEGFDVVIVCTNNDPQASYWQQRLEAAKWVCQSCQSDISVGVPP